MGHEGTASTGHPPAPARPGIGGSRTSVGRPGVTLDHEARWEQVDQLLHDDTFRLYSRVAGLFTLLYAQPLARICHMKASQVDVAADGRVSVTFDSFPAELPAPFAQLVVLHLARRGQASYVSHNTQWLFPGGVPGKHIATNCVREELVARDIHPSSSRKAAMLQLAATMPSSVLADVLGRYGAMGGVVREQLEPVYGTAAPRGGEL